MSRRAAWQVPARQGDQTAAPGFTRLARAYPATVGLVAVVSVLAIAQAATPGVGDLDAPTRWLGWSTHDVIRGQWWRLITPNLVNPAGNGLHVHTSAGAHYCIQSVGPRRPRSCARTSGGLAVAPRHRPRVRLGLFTSLALTHQHGQGYDGGTSGIVAGIGGAIVLLLWQHRGDSPTARRWWWTSCTVVALLFLLSTTWSANVNQVHGVSFVAGALMAAGLRPSRVGSAPARGMAILLVVVSLAVAGFRTIEQPSPAPARPTSAPSAH